VGLLRLRLFMPVAGIGILFYGAMEFRLSLTASAEPQRLSCSTLGTAGPKDNTHVTLTDFQLLTDGFVYMHKKNQPDGSWQSVFVPAAPKNQRVSSTMHDFHVLVYSSSVYNANNLKSLASEPELTGMVTNTITHLSMDQQNLLKSRYPGVNLDSVQIFEVGKRPKAPLEALVICGMGAALMLPMLLVILRCLKAPFTRG